MYQWTIIMLAIALVASLAVYIFAYGTGRYALMRVSTAGFSVALIALIGVFSIRPN